MKRTHPFFTLPGIIATAVLLLVLALGVWRSGGQAFSPGRLSVQGNTPQALGGYDSHASFEQQCSLCHAPLQATQDQLCLACHVSVAKQIQLGQGTHSLIPQVNQCYRCHSEHHGQDFNLLYPGLQVFDHSWTTFSLDWHQVDYDTQPMTCQACHDTQRQFALQQERCTDCHATHAASFMSEHSANYGTDCLACHDGVDKMVNFDHSQTDFPLLGKHTQVHCSQCHLDPSAPPGPQRIQFEEISSSCAACHAEPIEHQGLFGQDCQQCHSAQGWSPAFLEGFSFEHFASTGFSLALHDLDFDGQVLQCNACHADDLEQDVLPTCISCHSQGVDGFFFIQEHQEKFGTACLDCHDGVDRFSNFDHAQFFILDGAHQELACEQCHADQSFSGTPTACSDCHAEPEIHAGFFGLACQDCHTTLAWLPAQLRNHTFPLDHGEQGVVACETCHPTSYVEYTCYGCHEHQPADIEQEHLEENISLAELADCASCHPSGEEEEGED